MLSSKLRHVLNFLFVLQELQQLRSKEAASVLDISDRHDTKVQVTPLHLGVALCLELCFHILVIFAEICFGDFLFSFAWWWRCCFRLRSLQKKTGWSATSEEKTCKRWKMLWWMICSGKQKIFLYFRSRFILSYLCLVGQSLQSLSVFYHFFKLSWSSGPASGLKLWTEKHLDLLQSGAKKYLFNSIEFYFYSSILQQ